MKNQKKTIPCKEWINKEENRCIIEQAKRFSGVMSDATRTKILLLLDQYNQHDDDGHEKLYVSDLAEHIGVSVSAISHSLRSLESWNFVEKERRGQTMKYTLSEQGQQLLHFCQSITACKM